ncbi:DUF3231 family protein [Calidifontibacillus erzurumensis]|uniref:DUF3231 family protein n=1 Tax=Calidifontibacillus erzurumensis TaxID=2741433 RepID=A0A8J8GCH5_9BACI|nr:DUF3231 family protein [Calidifontibacillus erzurumensis]NSL50999.1 DUF3231 family protein [Calidifontibacillus erzurumensis]
MESITPLLTKADEMQNKTNLNSAELGKLWASYVGNTLSKGVLSYFSQHVTDETIKTIVQKALKTSDDFINEIRNIFEKEEIPIPIGITDGDVNKNAPRLFKDEFYLHYLKYAAKAGLSIYSTAIPLMLRKDVRDFINYCTETTVDLLTTLNEALLQKGVLKKPPLIPYPEKIDFVNKHYYFSGFIGKIRPLHALEIAYLHDAVENNVTSKALLTGFSQVAQNKQVKDLFIRGKDLTMMHIENCMKKLHNNDLPSHSLLDDLVEPSTIPPFSDKLMLMHKIDMFTMKIRTYANAMSLNGRRDIGGMYVKFLMDITLYLEDASNIMINEGWMEQPPQAVSREELYAKSKKNK